MYRLTWLGQKIIEPKNGIVALKKSKKANYNLWVYLPFFIKLNAHNITH